MIIPNPPDTREKFLEWFYEYYPSSYEVLKPFERITYDFKTDAKIMMYFVSDGAFYVEELVQYAKQEKERRKFAKEFNELLNEST